MTDDSPKPSALTIKSKTALPEQQQEELKSSLEFSKVVDTYTSLRPTNEASNEDLIGYLVMSSGHTNQWDKLTPPEKDWFFSSVMGTALSEAVANPDPILDTFSLLRKDGNNASTEELISFLIGGETWTTLAPPQQKWFIDKATLMDQLLKGKTTSSTGAPSAQPLPVPDDSTMSGAPPAPPPPSPMKEASSSTEDSLLAGISGFKFKKRISPETTSVSTEMSATTESRSSPASAKDNSPKIPAPSLMQELAAKLKTGGSLKNRTPPTSPAAAAESPKPQRMVVLKSRSPSPPDAKSASSKSPPKPVLRKVSQKVDSSKTGSPKPTSEDPAGK
jgi:hypothetical protein